MEKKTPTVEFRFTPELPKLFDEYKISLFVTTYQAQRLLCFTAADRSRLSMLVRVMPRPTGLAVRPDRMAVCSKNQVWFFAAINGDKGDNGSPQSFNPRFIPRNSHVTGDIAAHQLAWHNDDLIVVNTRFSCLCTLDPAWSFVPLWRPPFISSISPEDRCHLNGVCLDGNGPRYATALGETDEPEGWRAEKATGGVIVDVQAGEVIARGLSMPHSPVLHRGALWVLDSGRGALVTVDLSTGVCTTVARFPGYLRGLAFVDRFAFVGLSQIREKSIFGGVPIESLPGGLKCAIAVLNIDTGETIEFIEFTKNIEELFDLQILQGVPHPHVIGFEEETIDSLAVMPSNGAVPKLFA